MDFKNQDHVLDFLNVQQKLSQGLQFLASPSDTPMILTSLILGMLGYAISHMIKHRLQPPPSAPAPEQPPLPATSNSSKPGMLKRASSVHRIPLEVSPDQIQKLIESRRSIFPKDYTGDPVDDEAVDRMLEAAMWAPNHGKTEPWRFVVFAHEEKSRLLDATLKWYQERDPAFWAAAWDGYYPDTDAFTDYFEKAREDKWEKASHLVAICMRRQRPEDGSKQIPNWEEKAAVSCAVQNMHLMATSLRVAAYWSSWFEHYRESSACVHLMGLDAALGDVCMGMFVVGHSLKMEQYRAVRKPLPEVTSWYGRVK